jgi:hypothetical protein
VLPYLKEIDLALTICRDSQSGSLTAQFENFAADPAGWFIARGVSTVSFIKGRSDDSSPDDGPDLPRGSPEDAEGPLRHKWSQPPQKIMRGGKVYNYDTNASIWFFRGRRQVDWLLAPYVHRPPARGAHAFLERLRGRFGRHLSIGEISANIRTPSGRASLRYCYDAIWANHNFVSLSLYSGAAARPLFANVQPIGNRLAPIEVGWLSTGDSNLAVAKRRAALLRHYRPLLGRVGILVLPHHGAFGSFHLDLLRAIPNLGIGIAAAGPNVYGHPHQRVQAEVTAYCQFHQVSDSSSSRFTVMARV